MVVDVESVKVGGLWALVTQMRERKKQRNRYNKEREKENEKHNRQTVAERNWMGILGTAEERVGCCHS